MLLLNRTCTETDACTLMPTGNGSLTLDQTFIYCNVHYGRCVCYDGYMPNQNGTGCILAAVKSLPITNTDTSATIHSSLSTSTLSPVKGNYFFFPTQ